MIPVKDHSGLERDPRSGAIINTKKDEHARCIAAQKKAKQVQERLSNLENSMVEVKGALDRICKMLEEQK